MTYKELTEQFASLAYPSHPPKTIERIGLAIWNASPTGELQHISELYDLMRSHPEHVPEYVKALRNVERVAAE